ncbi:MAG: MlaD family protein [Zoogloeaceae bacterium]|jgi:phospholipid/cholesterol/gamma-HCH transport system substrate-binding protein|nr:MlaD family protein [Zoogloeaceae bacterium]
MESRAHALAAGFFTLFLGAAALLSFWFFSEKREETRNLTVVTRQNVSGLNPQAQVRYRGIRAGKVLDVRLDPDDVGNILIEIEVLKGIPVTRGTSARLAHQGITGIAHILLEDGGQDRRPIEEAAYIAMQPSLFDHLEESLPTMLAETSSFLKNANLVLNSENRQNLGQTLQNLEAATGRMDVTLTQMQKLFSDENVAGLSAAIQSSGPLMQETRALALQLREVSRRIDQALDDSGPTSVSALAPSVNNMAQELTATSRQLKRVLNMLEESPQSLVFGAPETARPGPGEKGFVAPASQK